MTDALVHARAVRPPGLARLATVFCLVLATALIPGCGRERSADGKRPQSGTAPPHQVVGLGRIEPDQRIVDLTSEVSGTVAAVRRTEGERVGKGETILELRREAEAAGLEQAVAAIHVRRADVSAAGAALSGARAKAGLARSQHERIASLFDKGSEPQTVLEDATTELESQTQEVRRLEAVLASAKATLEQARADSARARAEFERKSVVAPADGRVLGLDVTPGFVVTPQKPLGAFAPDGPVIARCEIDELFANLVSVGQVASVRSQGSVDTLGSGRVSFVGPYLRRKSLFSDEVGELEDRRVREIRVSFDGAEQLLLGARVECVIVVD